MALSAFAVLCVAGTASAAPLVLPADSPIYFQFNNIEQVNLANNLVVPGYAPATGTQGNWGVFNISTVQLGAVAVPNVEISGGAAFFADDGVADAFGMGQITGIFYGIQISGTDPTEAQGGYIDLFWEDPASDDVTNTCLSGACPPDAATVGLFTDGTFLARLQFDSGIDPTDSTVHIKSTTVPTINSSGFADSFASVDTSVVGVWTDVLNGNWFDTAFGERDLRFSNFFTGLPSWDAPGGTVGFRSNDPGRVFTAAAPEPTSMALFGLGLAALGIQQRRKLRATRS
jgi:hypothetical protein